MKIRQATSKELKELWGDGNINTKNYFIEKMNSKEIEFWAVEDENKKEIVGELYIFWNSIDKDEANNKDRAYLSAFRIEKEYRGLGLGSKLMNRVLSRIEEKGYKEVTIGVDNDDGERLKQMYKSWGFEKLVKWQHYDNHYMSKDNKPTYYEEPFGLYLKKIKN